MADAVLSRAVEQQLDRVRGLSNLSRWISSSAATGSRRLMLRGQ
jgi:hypothetical protein